jgi:chemotaxis family two-component system sensor kinase Cph1
LKLAYEELDTFSYTIAHDLKNPLAIIKMFAQILAKDPTSQEKHQKLVDSISSGADKMISMITEILKYSRIGRAVIQYQQIDVAFLISEIIKEMNIVYSKFGFNITTGEMPNLYGDKLMMTQVFSNLQFNKIQQKGCCF